MKMNVQGVRIIVNLHILTIAGLDVVLGNAWLRSIGRVLTDFDTMTMEFKLDGKKKVWKALTSKEIQPCEAHMLEKLCRGGAYCFAIMLESTWAKSVNGNKGEDDTEDRL